MRNVDEQRDLGFQVHASLKVATQIEMAVIKNGGMLTFTGQGPDEKNWDVMFKHCKTPVGLHLSTACSSGHHFRKVVIHWGKCRGDSLG